MEDLTFVPIKEEKIGHFAMTEELKQCEGVPLTVLINNTSDSIKVEPKCESFTTSEELIKFEDCTLKSTSYDDQKDDLKNSGTIQDAEELKDGNDDIDIKYEDVKDKAEENQVTEDDEQIPEKDNEPGEFRTSVGSKRYGNEEYACYITCYRCGFQTSQRSYFREHLFKHIEVDKEGEVQKFTCYKCDFQSTDRKSVQKHLVVHQLGEKHKQLKCQDCNYKAAFPWRLKRHQRTHEKSREVKKLPKKLQCVDCNFKTSVKAWFIKHLASHKEAKEKEVFMCYNCCFVTSHKGSLKKHIISKHNKYEKN